MKKVLLLSNMYPTRQHPSYGVFVKNFEDQMLEEDLSYDKIVMTNSKHKLLKLTKYLLFFGRVFLTLMLKKYEIVYVHYASITSIPVLWASAFKKLRIYTNVHGTDVMASSDKEKKLEANTRKICERSEKIIVPSDYFKEVIKERYAVEGVAIITYPSGGVDQTVFYPKKQEDTESNRRNRLFTIGFVSRIEYEKGWQTFLEGILLFKEQHPDLVFTALLVGEGSQSSEMLDYVKKNKLADVVKHEKFVTQNKLSDYYNAMDVFVFPSRKESLGLVGLEAMSCALPIIGTDIPAIAGYVEENTNGYLFEKDNAEDLAHKLSIFYDLSTKEKTQMQSNALTTSLKYNKTNLKETFKEIFNSNKS